MIKNLLNIPDAERKIYARHFIRNVVIEISFYALFQDLILKNITYLKENFKNLGFTSCQEIKQVHFALGINDEKPQMKTSDKVAGYVFENTFEKTRIELIENKLAITVFKYQNFENFFIKIEKIIDIINTIMSENKCITNITLKKVNSIISAETTSYSEITNILNDNFLVIMRNETIPFENFVSCFDIFKVKRNEYFCSVSSECKRRKLDEFEIILDVTINQKFSNSVINITQVLQNINNTNYSIFSWATTDYFKEVMDREEKE